MWMCLGVVFFSLLVVYFFLFFWGVHCLLFLLITTLCWKPLISKAGGDASLSLSVFVGLFIRFFFGLCSGCVLCWGLMRTQSSLWCFSLSLFLFFFLFCLECVFIISWIRDPSVAQFVLPPLHFTELTLDGLKPTHSEHHSGCQAGWLRIRASRHPHPLVLTTCLTVVSHFWGLVAPQ